MLPPLSALIEKQLWGFHSCACTVKSLPLLSLADWVILCVQWLFSKSFQFPPGARHRPDGPSLEPEWQQLDTNFSRGPIFIGWRNGRHKTAASVVFAGGVIFLSEWRDRLQFLVRCKGSLLFFWQSWGISVHLVEEDSFPLVVFQHSLLFLQFCFKSRNH